MLQKRELANEVMNIAGGVDPVEDRAEGSIQWTLSSPVSRAILYPDLFEGTQFLRDLNVLWNTFLANQAVIDGMGFTNTVVQADQSSDWISETYEPFRRPRFSHYKRVTRWIQSRVCPRLSTCLKFFGIHWPTREDKDHMDLKEGNGAQGNQERTEEKELMMCKGICQSPEESELIEKAKLQHLKEKENDFCGQHDPISRR